MRIYIVGTDTSVGKTAVTAALLRAAAARGLRAVPFKPAQTGPAGSGSDIARLLRASGLATGQGGLACPHHYDAPVAPGMAEDPTPFLDPRQTRMGDDRPPAPLRAAISALDAWERRHRAELSLIEGAGGLQVPMPGGWWQPRWIYALASYAVVVGREGLGTINHTMQTIVGLRHLGRTPLGFLLSQTDASRDPSADSNAAVIAAASGVPHLGTLPHYSGSHAAPAPDLLDALLARLPKLASAAN
ncbi:MAG: dethiobiotin synthase [Myxococcota bacterium]